MKAILVVDEMPKSCSECLLNIDGLCAGTKEPIYSINCPLKPMPQPKNNSDEWLGDVWVEGYEAGWNKLLKEIENG